MSAQRDAATTFSLKQAYATLPLQFEVNRGQHDPAVRFFSRGTGYQLFLTSAHAILSLGGDGREAVVRIGFGGSAANPQPSGRDELPGKVNYFVGSDPADWRTEISTYRRVQYPEVYPGIDLVYHGERGRLEFDFVVAPGADPDEIELSFDGGDEPRVDSDGHLVLQTAAAPLRWERPLAYQVGPAGRETVEAAYVLQDAAGASAADRIAFRIGAYDRTRPLIIDPTFVYSTLIGGSGWDLAFGLAVDASGHAYITGRTFSPDYPTAAALQPVSGGEDAFVTKLNADGTGVIYSTYLGSPRYTDVALGLAIDSAGSAYVAGITSGFDFPTTPGALQVVSPDGSYQDGFVLKLNPSGSALVYSTYLSGAQYSHDEVNDIAIDAAGNAYVTGSTWASSFPTRNPIQPSYAVNHNGDAFVTKLNATGSDLVFSTHLGGSLPDTAYGIAVDAAGRAYVTGSTNSADFPTRNAVQPTYGGGGSTWPSFIPGDVFVTRLAADGSALEYSTFLGLHHQEVGYDIAVDGAGSAYVTGYASWSHFPTTAGAFQTSSPDGGMMGFVTKFDPAGGSLVYSTLLSGAQGQDAAQGIAVDDTGHAYVTGQTFSPLFPLRDAAQPQFGGFSDAFVTKFNPTGTALVYSTYIGGTHHENGGNSNYRFGLPHVAVDSAGRAYVSGWSSSVDFPTDGSAYQRANRGSIDAFVVKLSGGATAAPLTLDSIRPNRGGNAGTVTATIFGTGFTSGTAFRLTSAGQPDIVPVTVEVDASGDFATAVFDLRGAAAGDRNVVATNPDGTSVTLFNGFVIDPGGSSRIWSDVVGPPLNLKGNPVPYTFTFGNRGNVDAYGVVVFLGGFPQDATVRIGFPITPPGPTEPPVDWDDIPELMPNPNKPGTDMLPVVIPVIRAGESVTLGIRLSVPSARCIELTADGISPLHLNSGIGNICTGLLADTIKCVASSPFLGPAGCAIGWADAVRQGTCNFLEGKPAGTQVYKGVELIVSSVIGCATGGVSTALKYAYKSLNSVNACSEAVTGKELGVCIANAFDPNDKFGPSGDGADRYLTGDEPFQYMVIFENKPEATAPANEVIVIDQLDAAKFDLSTFAFGPVAFGETVVVMPPPGNEFTTDVDLRPAKNTIVRINGKLDTTTALITWRFQSLDPATGEPTFDVMSGFLPPNVVRPEGDGSVFFTVSPRPDLPTGTTIRNMAKIFFDFNEPIDTPEWLNTIDRTAPQSTVGPLAGDQCTDFTVTWAGSDAGSGVQSYSVYVSVNGAAFTPWQSDVTMTSAVFNGAAGNTYTFYSVARDHVGNTEDAPAVGDVTVTVRDLEPPTVTAPAPLSFTTGSTSCGVTISDETLGTATYADNCAGVTISRDGVPAGGLFPLGTTVITWTATDAAGNAATAEQRVTVTDVTPPTISCTADITVTTDAGSCSAVVQYDPPTVTDNCPGVTSSCSLPTGSTFPVGRTTVSCTAMDVAGNTASCSFDVVVLGPRDVLVRTASDLAALRSTVTSKQDGDRLDKATGSLSDAISAALWLPPCRLDAAEGDKVFHNLKSAITHLSMLTARLQVQPFVDSMVNVARQLATIAINAAAAAGGNQKEIDKARETMRRAEIHVGSGNYEAAMEAFRLAWQTAVKITG